jgi:hypothetical protein
MLAAIGLFLCLWVVGSLVSACVTPVICSIIGFDEEMQVITSVIIVGLVFAIIMMGGIMGGQHV